MHDGSIFQNFSTGISFCGSDVGGFFGDPEEELLVRWYQAAVYQPFYRAHAHLDSKRREPYLLPEPERSAARDALRTRYKLLSLWYTMFYEHERFGLPVMRPMLAEYPLDKNVYALDDQYMLADKLLVRPVLQKGATDVNVYFPSDIWYDFDTYTTITTPGWHNIPVDSLKVPVFQKGGTIIPKKEIARQSTIHMRNDPVSLFVAVDSEQKASGTLYIDDEESYMYRSGQYTYLKFELSGNILSGRHVDRDAYFGTESKLGRIVIAGLDKVPTEVSISTAEGSQLLNIVNVSDQYFEIEPSNIRLTLEWEIMFNDAKRNTFWTGALFVTVFWNILRHFYY